MPTPSIPPSELESICRALADGDNSFTGTEIGLLLSQLGFSDPAAGNTKWKRLLAAFCERQSQDCCGTYVFKFILEAMKPVRYVGRSDVFETRRIRLNHVLIFAGFELSKDGQLRPRTAAKTLSEAEERAGRMRAELMKRNVHHDVLKFCRAEFLQDNYFHAVLEATKSVADKIRALSGLPGDGAELAVQALASGKAGMPFIAFNRLCTDSEKSEQNGLMNLMQGMFGTFRNTTAHAPKVSWNMTEQDALDLLTMVSFLHRRLDGAVRTPRNT